MADLRILTPAGGTPTSAGGGYGYEREALDPLGARIVECAPEAEAFIAAAKGPMRSMPRA
ncbi:MAG: hypothetical protein R3E68_19515 [Burkholderiaceae bacterium]